jgi:hypothetical protein
VRRSRISHSTPNEEAARAAGQPVIDLPLVDPAHLADLLWEMQTNQGTHGFTYPADLFTTDHHPRCERSPATSIR